MERKLSHTDKTLDQRISEAVAEAEVVFWRKVMEHFPEIDGDELDPSMEEQFNDATRSAVINWVESNEVGR